MGTLLALDVAGSRERLAVWIDPAPGQRERDKAPDHVFERSVAQVSVDRVGVRFWEMNGDTRGVIDDLRVGATWQAVAP